MVFFNVLRPFHCL